MLFKQSWIPANQIHFINVHYGNGLNEGTMIFAFVICVSHLNIG